MQRLLARRTTALLIAFLFMSLLTTSVAQADRPDRGRDDAKARASAGLSIPVAGTFTDATGGTGRFAGTLNLLRFASQNNQIVAVGILTGTLTDSAGNVLGTVLRTVAIPINTAAAQVSCQILHLELGPLDLNLLGLTVHLNRIVLDITAVPGPGNLLGNLLCALANLLNGSANLNAIVALLNQILGALGGLGV